MRKTIFTLLMLAVAIGMSAHELLSNAEVDAQWRTKTISVKNGGQSPNVVMLLKAFNKALPTWVVGDYKKPFPQMEIGWTKVDDEV